MTSFTVIDVGHPTEVEATLTDDRVWINAAGVEKALGWVLRSEGLCRGSVCIPVTRQAGLVNNGNMNLSALAELLGRPLASSPEEGAAYLGPPFDLFDQMIAGLEAPDFQLPDLDDRLHSLSEHRGSKVLLAVWASW
jgi:hypothetical protein